MVGPINTAPLAPCLACVLHATHNTSSYYSRDCKHSTANLRFFVNFSSTYQITNPSLYGSIIDIAKNINFNLPAFGSAGANHNRAFAHYAQHLQTSGGNVGDTSSDHVFIVLGLELENQAEYAATFCQYAANDFMRAAPALSVFHRRLFVNCHRAVFFV